MKKTLWGASLIALVAGSANAATLDRSSQNIAPLFNESSTASASFGVIQPNVTGEDALGNDYEVGETYNQVTLSWTHNINEVFSYTAIVDQPYGANVDYNNDPGTSTLGGTGADLSSRSLTLLGRYKASPRLSFHGGVSVQSITAEVLLNGQSYQNGISASFAVEDFNAGRGALVPEMQVADLAGAAAAAARIAAAGGPGAADPADLITVGTFDATFGTVTGSAGGPVVDPVTNFGVNRALFGGNDGYAFDMEETVAVQPIIGMAYEIPDIALRLSGTYFFETDHGADTEENVLGATVDGDVEFVAPQALNIDFQTGIATDTLLTASYRWAQYSAVDLVPDRLGSDLVNLDDTRRYTLGVGRRFNEEWSGSLNFLYMPEGEDDFVSPLGPTNGYRGVSIGARYVNGGLTASAGYNYTILGDARAEVGGAEAAKFEGSTSQAFGISVSYEF